jgi:hypothetical protein
MTKLSHGLSGVAGEYFVCAELSRRGFIATLTLKNTQGIDVLAARPTSSQAIKIQVKTSQTTTGHWVLNEKAETAFEPNLFYVFVRLRSAGQLPDFHVVPSDIVAQYTATHHKEWLSELKANGTARKDTSMRAFHDRAGEYKDAWELIDVPLPQR